MLNRGEVEAEGEKTQTEAAEKDEMQTWLENHSKLSEEQKASLQGIYNQTGEMQDVELSYSEMLNRGEVEAENETKVDEDVDSKTNENGRDDADQPDHPSDVSPMMSLDDAVRLVNGNLDNLTFAQIEMAYEALHTADRSPNSEAGQALEKLRAFSEQKMQQAAPEDFALSMENAPELDAWLRINDDVQNEINKGEAQQEKLARNKALQGRINKFYQEYDQANALDNINSSSAAMVEANYNGIEALEGYDPLARDENGKLVDSRFEKISEFYDELQINNDDTRIDTVTNSQLKRNMADLAVLEAQTELLKNPEFAKMSPEAQKEALAKEVNNRMQQGIANIISAELGDRFTKENAGLIAKLQDENLPEAEREALLKEYQEKEAAFKEAEKEQLDKQTAYFAEEPVQLTEMQKNYLSGIYKRNGKDFNPETTWNDLSAEDKEILSKGAEGLKELALTPEQAKAGNKVEKPAPFKTSNAVVLSTLYTRTKNLEHANKRIAQKTGFMKMWDKVKAFDKKLSKEHPKLWGFAKNFALTATVSLTVGAPGVAAIAAWKAGKAISAVSKKAKQENMSFYKYVKAHPREGVNASLAVAGAVLSVGFAGADMMTHGLSSMGLAGHAVDYSIQHGTGLGQTLTEMASNFHGNMASVSDIHFTKESLAQGWEGVKNTAASGRFLSRLGLTAGNAASVASAVYNKQRAQGAGKWKAFKASLGAGLGAMSGTALSLGIGAMASHAPAPDNSVDGITGAGIKTPNFVEAPMVDVSGIEDPVLQPVPLTPEFVEAPMVDVSNIEDPVLHPVPVDDHGNTTVNDDSGNHQGDDYGHNGASAAAADKALYEEFLKRRSIGADNPEEAAALANHDIEQCRRLVRSGHPDQAREYANKVFNRTEIDEAEQAVEHQTKRDSIAKDKDMNAVNHYRSSYERLQELKEQGIDESSPEYQKALKDFDKASKDYSKRMVNLTDRELKHDAKQGDVQAQADREFLRKGKYGEEMKDFVDEKVAGVGVYHKSSLSDTLTKWLSHGKGR